MTLIALSLSALSLSGLVTLAPAPMLSQAGDPDGVIATAPATLVVLDSQPSELADPGPVVQDPTAPAHGLSTDQQVARWIADRSGSAQTWHDPPNAEDGPLAPDLPGARMMRGEVFGAIGTGGYRAFGGTVVLPVGDDGWLGLSFVQGRNVPWGPGYDSNGHVWPDADPNRTD